MKFYTPSELRSLQPEKVSYKHVSFDRERLVIVIHKPGQNNPYEVDLARCRNSTQVLDWIFQLKGKGWVTDEMLGEFIRIVEDICHEIKGRSAQGVFCAGGIDRKVIW